MFWNISRIYLFFFSIKNIKSDCYIIFFQNFSNHLFLIDSLFLPSYIFLMKVLIFLILSACFPYFHSLIRLLQRIEKTFVIFYWWDLLLLFCFLSNQENVYMIHHTLDLFYDNYNTITQHNQRQNHYLSSTVNYFDISF